MFWQCLGLLESKWAVQKKFWTIQTKGNGHSFHGKQCSVSESQCRWFESCRKKDMGLVTCNANYNTHSPSLSHKKKTENESRLLKNSEENRHSWWNFCGGKEADIALFLQVKWITKIRKNLWSKQVSDCPNWWSQAMMLVKCRNKQNGSKSTNHKPWPFELVHWSKPAFPRRSAKMIDGTEKPKIPSNIK